MPSLNFLSSSPPTDAVRFESEPPGAEVKTASGETCRTPCQLSVAVAPEVSATFALNGYQPQTVSLRSFSSAHLAPNPVYVELAAAPPPPAAKKHRKKPAIAKVRPSNSVASAASDAPAAPAAAAPTPPASAPAESAASATNYPWPEAPKVK
jgi:hypothetical protein